MKRRFKKNILLSIMMIIEIILLSGCGREESNKMVNELSFSLDGISDLIISYDDENIGFFTSESDELVIKEYMSKNKKSYYAKVSINRDSIRISEGGKPIFKDGFTRYVEVYLPASYTENLKVTVTDGSIDMSDMELELKSIRVDCTSGRFKLNKAAAEEIYFSSTSGKLELEEIIGNQIRIETTQGNVICRRADGVMNYVSTSGNAEFLSVSGSGVYKANNSGKLSVIYDEVNGNLSFFNKNDDVEIKLPENLSFEFEAITKNGSIDTNLEGEISVNVDSTTGTVGDDPAVKIKVETKNGNIKVRQ